MDTGIGEIAKEVAKNINVEDIFGNINENSNPMDLMTKMMDPEKMPSRALYQQALLDAPGGRIAAGSDEILRNIISERVLGLPPEIRVDKELPFNQLPTGSE